MKITGQILKENRERKGVTLSEVSLATKITVKTLLAIEEGDPATLPPKTFLRGFVRSYAIYLGLNVDQILQTFLEEMGTTLSRPVLSGPNPAELNAAATEAAAKSTDGVTPLGATGPAADSSNQSTPNVPPSANSSSLFNSNASSPATPTRKLDAEHTLRDEPSLMTKGGIVGGILLLIVLIVFLKGKMDSYESERNTNHTEPVNVETAAPQIETPIVVKEKTPVTTKSADDDQDTEQIESRESAESVIPKPSPSASPTPSSTPKPSPSPTPASTPKPSPTPSPTPSATPKPSPSASPKPSASPSPSPSPTPAASPTPSASPIAAGKTHEILIEALDQVDIEVTVDGEASRTIKLRGEQVQSIKVKRKAILKLSDGGAVNLIVNGVDRGVPGDLGKPTRVELP